MTSPTVAPVGSAQQASPTRVSFDEFLAWADEDTLAEWVDGEIVPMSPSSLDQQRGIDERYHLGPVDADGTYRSVVLVGFGLRVAWLWQRPLPAVEDLKQEIGA